MINIPDLAHQVLDVCASLKSGERVWINSWDHTVDLAAELAWECEKRNCPVVVTVQPEDLWLRSLIEAPLEVVDGLPSHQAALLRETDVYIYTLGPRNPIPWDKIPEDRQKLATFWFFEKNRFVEQWKTIARQRKVRMLGIEATLATPERAKALGLDFEEWNRVMFDGCMADYLEVERHGKVLASLLSGEGEVHISTPHGTDFRFRLDSRPVDFSYGQATPEKVEKGDAVFLPSGGVGVTLDEGSGVGTVVFDLPVRTGEGTIEQLTLELEGGRVAHVSAERNQKVFERYLNEGKGEVDRFGFFGLGLNPNLRYGFTQDDKVLGSVEVNFGDNKDRGGKNNASDSWWACVSSATVTIDGTQVLKNGSLLV
ncbi:MAG TPA: aminopeptidase [Candidatus Bathyarchaeia archaeon]|nr:aminopeptidase [Candidatus Bathyarchaeia archaeon]